MKILTTSYPTSRICEKMAKKLISGKACKCASFWPASSHYVWKGKFVRGKEFLFECKCANSKQEKLARKLILASHPYSLPMLYAVSPSQVHPAYSIWLARK